MTSGLVSSSTLPSSCIPAPACSSCCGFSSGGRVNMYGVWHVPTAATISPIPVSYGVWRLEAGGSKKFRFSEAPFPSLQPRDDDDAVRVAHDDVARIDRGARTHHRDVHPARGRLDGPLSVNGFRP